MPSVSPQACSANAGSELVAGVSWVGKGALRGRASSRAGTLCVRLFGAPRGNKMNRRSILRVSAIMGLGLAVIPGSAIAQQEMLKEQAAAPMPQAPQGRVPQGRVARG